jgi:hypothetical protein
MWHMASIVAPALSTSCLSVFLSLRLSTAVQYGQFAGGCLLTGFLLWPSYYGHFLGYFFYGGVSPSKNGLSAPSLERAQLRSRARVFLYT